MKSAQRFSDRVQRNLQRGEILDGDARYLMIRADVLMGMFKNLDSVQAALALQALADSVHEHGAKSARMYREMGIGSGNSEASRLLSTIEATAPELGWGYWRIDHETAKDQTPGLLRLHVTNSPFAVGYGASDVVVCTPICGMLEVVGEMVMAQPVEVVEIECAAVAETESCYFEVNARRS